jgi:hypothetical protein
VCASNEMHALHGIASRPTHVTLPYLGSARPVPPERRGGGVAVGAAASARLGAARLLLPAAVAAGSGRLPVQAGGRAGRRPGLGAPRGRRAQRERAVHGAPVRPAAEGLPVASAAAVLIVVVRPRRGGGEQQRAAAAAAAVEQAARAGRRLVQHLDWSQEEQMDGRMDQTELACTPAIELAWLLQALQVVVVAALVPG